MPSKFSLVKRGLSIAAALAQCSAEPAAPSAIEAIGRWIHDVLTVRTTEPAVAFHLRQRNLTYMTCVTDVGSREIDVT